MAGLKRTAEIQLTKEEEVDDEELMEITPPDGFKKADANVLASRPMKGLPKRANADATYDAPSSKNLENGVKLNPFGLPSSPFTFSKPTPPSAPRTEQPAPVGSPFKFFAPAVSPSATATTKLMSSIMGSLPQPNGVHTNTPTETSPSRYKDDADMTYYASLRGLNESFRSFIDELLKDEPYADLSAALYDQYKEYRSNIQKEYDKSKKPRTATRVNGIATSPSSSSKPASTPPAGSAAALSMPTPPKAFSFGGSPIVISPSNSTTPGSAVGGFKPDFAAISSSSTPPSAFTLPSSSTSGGKDAPSSSDVKASFSSTMPTKPSPFGGASSSSFTFGSTSPSTTDKQVGSTSSSTTDKSSDSTGSNTADKLFAPFGSGSGFGNTSVFGKPSLTSGGPSSANGSGSTGGFTLAPAFGSSGLSTSGFKFGTPSSVPFAFGSKATSSDSKDSGTAETSEPVASSSKPVTTSSSPGDQDTTSTTAKPDASASTPSAVSSAPASTGAAEGSDAPAGDNIVSKLFGENPNDLEGEGEEDEETLISARVKIFRFMKQGQEPGWVEFGVGMLRVKKHKKNGSFRLLSRNSANGKIMMNFKLYAGFKLSRAKHILNFMGHDNGEGAMFRVRVRDESSAAAIQETVEKAVSLKA